MEPSPFDQLRATAGCGDVAGTLEALVAELRREGKYHELFDALLMRGRLRVGLPMILAGGLDDLSESVRNQVEQVYLEACREVGGLLIDSGRLREAWMYLRPVGDPRAMAAALERVEPTDENLNDLIEISLHEGVAIPLGYRLVLERYGTCNAITAFEGALAQRPRADQQTGAALLVRHVHRELLASLKTDIARQEGQPPSETTLAALVADRDWLFGQHSYHIDTTHLASTVRYARVLEEPADLRLAIDLTDYGRRLHPQFQFPGEEPFHDTYPAHGLLFRALLGEQVEEALTYFDALAEKLDPAEVGSLPAEVLVTLLARSGKLEQALSAAARWLGPGVHSTGFAPSLMELSRQAGSFETLIDVCQQRGDLVGFAAGLVERQLRAHVAAD